MANLDPTMKEVSFYALTNATTEYIDYVRDIVTRYVDSPAIFSWELMNEPRCERIKSAGSSDVKPASEGSAWVIPGSGVVYTNKEFQHVPTYLDKTGCERIPVYEGNQISYRVLNETQCQGRVDLGDLSGNSRIWVNYMDQNNICLGSRSTTKWTSVVSEYIKTIDKNHMVGVGSEGFLDDEPHSDDSYYNGFFGESYKEVTRLKSIDYGTIHPYVKQLKRNLDPKDPATYNYPDETWVLEWLKRHNEVNSELNKPLLVGELGVLSAPGLEDQYVPK